MPDAFRYAVGVGANLGERVAAIARAGAVLEASGVARIERRSALIESVYVGTDAAQPPYLNGAWVVVSALGPHQFLDLLLASEAALGRGRARRWAPRIIDLDLLLRDDALVIHSPVLTVPHPRLVERVFALAPLATIAGDWRHPLLDATIADLAAGLGWAGSVRNR